MKYLRRLICKIFGHNHYMKFHPAGKYYCFSAGPYDCLCYRCDFDWISTQEGRAVQLEQRIKF